MKDKPKIFTILAGVGTILLGIFTCVISIFILVGVVSGTDPLLMLATFGLLLIFQIILFFLALGVGITIIVIGSLQVRLGTLLNYEYSKSFSAVVGYSVFDSILIILSLVGIFAGSGPVLAASAVIGSVSLISLIFKIIDYKIFKKKVNKGLISVEKPETKVDLSKLNLTSLTKEKKDPVSELEKIKDLKDKGLITDEEYEKLRKKFLRDISKKN